MKKTFYLLVVALFIFGCKDQINNDSLEMSELEEVAFYPQNVMVSKSVRKAASELKIIKESHLRFETTSIEKTYQSITSLLLQNNGFIQRDISTKNYGNIERELVVRIPTDAFQSVIDSVAANVKVFDRKEISQRDVTEEFIDLEARLNSKKKLESRYLELLGKAKNVKEILEIEKELAKIREEIESKQGRLEYLQNKVSLSTINISFYEQISIEKAPSKTYFSRIIKAFKGGFTGIGEFIIGVLYLWPFVLIAIIVFVFVRKKLKRSK